MKNIRGFGALSSAALTSLGTLGSLRTEAMAAAARQEEIMAEVIYLTGATAEEIRAAYCAYPGSLGGFRDEVLSGKLTRAKIQEMGNVAH